MTQLRPQPGRSILVPMLIILAVSALAGFAYNNFTALGVRFKQADAARPAALPVTQTNTIPEAVVATATNYAPIPEGAGPMPTPKYRIAAVTWTEVKPLLAENKLVLVDARGTYGYKAEHIPGAVSVPSTSGYDMGNFAKDRPKDQPIVVYCSSEHCPLSYILAANLINQFDFSNVKIMTGGFDEYRRQEDRTAKEGAK